jgi:hypothetical protein
LKGIYADLRRRIMAGVGFAAYGVGILLALTFTTLAAQR